MPKRNQTKQRSLSQRIGDRGEELFSHLAAELGFSPNKIEKDYGIDFYLEVFKDSGTTEAKAGERFFVQVKTNNLPMRKSGVETVGLALSDIEDHRRNHLPVFLILVKLRTKQAYFLFLQQNLPDPISGETMPRFSVPYINRLDDLGLFAREVRQAYDFMRYFVSPSPPQLLSARAAQLEQLDPRFNVAPTASTKGTNYNLYPRTTTELKVQAVREEACKNLKKLLRYGGEQLFYADELKVTGTPIIAEILGKPAQFKLGLWRTFETEVVFAGKSDSISYQFQVKFGGPIQQLRYHRPHDPFSFETLWDFENGATSFSFEYDWTQWNGTSIVNLPYLQKLLRLGRIFSGGDTCVSIILNGREVKYPINVDTEGMREFVSGFDFLRRLVEIANRHNPATFVFRCPAQDEITRVYYIHTLMEGLPYMSGGTGDSLCLTCDAAEDDILALSATEVGEFKVGPIVDEQIDIMGNLVSVPSYFLVLSESKLDRVVDVPGTVNIKTLHFAIPEHAVVARIPSQILDTFLAGETPASHSTRAGRPCHSLARHSG